MRLPGRIGWSNAMELLLTGDRVDADDRQGDGSRLEGRPARRRSWTRRRPLARRLVAAAPLAQRATKEMAARGAHLPWEDAVRLGESMRRVVGAIRGRDRGHACGARRAHARVAGSIAVRVASRGGGRADQRRPARGGLALARRRRVVEGVDRDSPTPTSSGRARRRPTASVRIRRFGRMRRVEPRGGRGLRPARGTSRTCCVRGLPIVNYRADVTLEPVGGRGPASGGTASSTPGTRAPGAPMRRVPPAVPRRHRDAGSPPRRARARLITARA